MAQQIRLSKNVYLCFCLKCYKKYLNFLIYYVILRASDKLHLSVQGHIPYEDMHSASCTKVSRVYLTVKKCIPECASLKHTLFFYRGFIMEYNNDILQEAKKTCELVKVAISVDLIDSVNRTIAIKAELEELDKILSSPERCDKDMVRHMLLVKEYSEVRDKQIKSLLEICELVKRISVNLQDDYTNTVQTIKE